MIRLQAGVYGLALVAGCANLAEDLGTATGGTADTGADAAADSVALRLDVYPSSGVQGVEPQSFSIARGPSMQGLHVDLQPTRRVSGVITGYEATPYMDVQVPGETVPVVANVTVIQPGTVAGASTNTSDRGTYSLQVPAGEGYQISVVPSEPALLPFVVSTDQVIDADRNYSLDIDFGVPVWGTVTMSDGSPAPTGTRVRLVDPVTGVVGASVEVDEAGRYMLRAEPGGVVVEVYGEAGSYIPTIETEAEATDPDGVQVDIDLGTLAPVVVQGRLIDSSGKVLEQAPVRFTARSLDGARGSLEVETDTDVNGRFSTQLLPGQWTVEYIPPYEADGISSPLEESLSVSTSDINLGTVKLPDRVSYTGRVLSPDGPALAGVIVTAREIGFDHYVYSTVTDDFGDFELDLPQTPVELSFAPPGGTFAVTFETVDDPTTSGQDHWLEWGTRLSGTVTYQNEAVPLSLIEIRDADDVLYGSTLTGEDGSFSIRIDIPGD